MEQISALCAGYSMYNDMTVKTNIVSSTVQAKQHISSTCTEGVCG